MRLERSRADERRLEMEEARADAQVQADNEYQEWCERRGFDPDDPTVARSYFGEPYEEQP